MKKPISLPIAQYYLYAGFGSRFCSLLLDFVFIIPVGVIVFILNTFGKTYYIAGSLFTFIFFIWYHVFLVSKYGGTPGKLITGLRILKLDFEPIGLKEAVLRHSVEIVLSVLSTIILIYAVCKTDEHTYMSLSWLKRATYLTSFYPWYHILSIASSIWVWGELIVLLTNEKKRALHDFIAGTVVVDIKCLQVIQETAIDGESSAQAEIAE